MNKLDVSRGTTHEPGLSKKHVSIHEGVRSDRYHVHTVNGLSRESSLSVAPGPRTKNSVTNQSDETPPHSYCLRSCAFLTLSTVSRAAGSSSRTIAITHAAIAACRVGELRDAGDGIWTVR